MKLPPTSRAKVLDVLFQANKSDGDKTARAAARDAIASVPPLIVKMSAVAISEEKLRQRCRHRSHGRRFVSERNRRYGSVFLAFEYGSKSRCID